MAITKSKTYEIIDARKAKHKKGPLKLDDGTVVKFNSSGFYHTDDAGEARAINEKFGHETKRGNGNVVVCELETYNERRDRKVRRVNYLTVPALPWHKYDENGKRIK